MKSKRTLKIKLKKFLENKWSRLLKKHLENQNSRFLCPLKAAPEKGNDLFENNINTKSRKLSRGEK